MYEGCHVRSSCRVVGRGRKRRVAPPPGLPRKGEGVRYKDWVPLELSSVEKFVGLSHILKKTKISAVAYFLCKVTIKRTFEKCVIKRTFEKGVL